MRINVYSQELTDEVLEIEKQSNTGMLYKAAQLVLHSSPMLHHPPEDDDRSAVTFWLPSSQDRRHAIAKAFRRIADIFDGAQAVEANEVHAVAQSSARFVAGMREALEPFANEAASFDEIPGVYRCHDNVEIWQKPNYRYKITVGDLRRARAILAEAALKGEGE